MVTTPLGADRTPPIGRLTVMRPLTRTFIRKTAPQTAATRARCPGHIPVTVMCFTLDREVLTGTVVEHAAAVIATRRTVKTPIRCAPKNKLAQ